MSLKVLLVSSSSGSLGGGEFYLVGLAEGLCKLGHQVSLLLSSHPRMDALAEMLHPFGAVRRMAYTNTYDSRFRCGGALFSQRQIRDVAKLLNDLEPDIVHINKQNLEDGLDLLLAARQSGLPFVATVHVTRSMESLNAVAGWIRDRIAMMVLRRIRCHFLTIADSGAADLFQHGRGEILKAKIHRVWNGVRDVAPGDRAKVRREWGCTDDDIVLGCAARLERVKNPGFLLSILPQLPSRVRLVWIGDGSLRAKFWRQVENAGLQDRVHIDGWRQDAVSRLAGFDAFVLPSESEGLPFAILEAMSAGLPCVASGIDGVGEAVIDGETGYLCNVNDTCAWVAALRKIVADPGERKRLGDNGRFRFQECFTLDSMAQATADVYTAVLADQACAIDHAR